jgi:hypothetical protein
MRKMRGQISQSAVQARSTGELSLGETRLRIPFRVRRSQEFISAINKWRQTFLFYKAELSDISSYRNLTMNLLGLSLISLLEHLSSLVASYLRSC